MTVEIMPAVCAGLSAWQTARTLEIFSAGQQAERVGAGARA
jgi:hypothetical protein